MVFEPPATPTQKTDKKGMFFDFNLGLRVSVPEGNYRVRFIDRTSHLTVYDAKASGVMAISSKRFFVNFRLEVWEEPPENDKKKKEGKLIFSHDYNAKGKKVLLKFAGRALGDMLAWFPYAEIFRQKHQCKLYVIVDKKYEEILKPGYPELHFISNEERPADLYATYYIGLFAPWDDRDLQPVDWLGLQAHAAYILGVFPGEERVRLVPSRNAKKIRPQKPYVCIATQATAQSKYWNNANGWLQIVDYLKKQGYRVLCVDRDKVVENGIFGNTIPYGCEDFTGNRTLQERVDLISGADFFIGLPSGLSWLAWGCNVPVVMIVGFSLPGTEFYTPYRVQQFHTCNGCANDQRNEHNYEDFGACPHHRGTDREFECTRCITPEYVQDVIEAVRKDISS
ncbi:glycosyltransferase [Anaerovibrio sp. JC8]|nr:glycosyltransferase [Anaerovibrio sp. JC8]